jgi:hypothetical protein
MHPMSVDPALPAGPTLLNCNRSISDSFANVRFPPRTRLSWCYSILHFGRRICRASLSQIVPLEHSNLRSPLMRQRPVHASVGPRTTHPWVPVRLGHDRFRASELIITVISTAFLTHLGLRSDTFAIALPSRVIAFCTTCMKVRMRMLSIKQRTGR